MIGHGSLDCISGPGPICAGDISPGNLREHVGLDSARCDRVARHTPIPKVGGKRFRNTVDGRLASGIQRVVANTKQSSRDGRHQNQPSAFLTIFVCVLSDEELGSNIETEHIVESLFGDVLGFVKALGSGIGHDNVDLPEMLLGLFEQPSDLGHPGNVGLDGDGLAAKFLDLLDDFIR